MGILEFTKYFIRGMVGLALLPLVLVVMLAILGNAALNNLINIFIIPQTTGKVGKGDKND